MADKETPYQRWYKNNKESHNRLRRSRYHSDADYREDQVERARAHRRSKATEVRAPREDSKLIIHEGNEIRVYRIGAVSVMIGASDQFIRKMESQGVIPATTVKSAHRYYTENQVGLMRELVEALFSVPINSKAREQALEEKRAKLHQYWKE